MAALKADLCTQTWDAFLLTFIKLYDKHCPLKKMFQRKPWITSGIANACKEKNQLYREYVKLRTKAAEQRYKAYKNQFINILRVNEKKYYHSILEQLQNNTKETWKILNGIIKNGKKGNVLPNYFTNKDKAVTNIYEIANAFNDFFLHTGYN